MKILEMNSLQNIIRFSRKWEVTWGPT